MAKDRIRVTLETTGALFFVTFQFSILKFRWLAGCQDINSMIRRDPFPVIDFYWTPARAGTRNIFAKNWKCRWMKHFMFSITLLRKRKINYQGQKRKIIAIMKYSLHNPNAGSENSLFEMYILVRGNISNTAQRSEPTFARMHP